MLTNFGTVFKRLQRLKELEEVDFDDVAGSSLTKKELLHLKRERDKLDRSLGGIRHMSRVPSAIWVVDTKKEHIAVSEARKLNIPVIAILDTNCDPDEVTYPIPGNDDAIRSVALLTRVIADAVADGLIARAGAATDSDEKPDAQLAAAEPLAEWERELLPSRPADEAVTVAANGTATATLTAPVETAIADPVASTAAVPAPTEAAAAEATTATEATAAAAPATEATASATAEAATAEATTAAAAAAEATATAAPAAEATATAPATEATATAPATEATATAAPTAEAPATEAPATEATATAAPTAEATTEAPATKAPATEAPTAEASATDAAATEATATDAGQADASGA
jgi:small subunit ribosomal protein S2